MGNNVNTLPSSDVDSLSIRWITFATRDKENVIDAKKMVKGRDAYIPEVGKVQSTYIIEKNNIWMRCVKVANKLRKMNLYLEALDRNVKKDYENPSVGIILCSSKDKEVVEYSLSKNMPQTMISEYRLKLIDKKILEMKLKEMKSLLEEVDKQLEV